MLLTKYIDSKKNGVFQVSKRVIWFSSLFIGVLASIPKIMQLNITLVELGVDASVALLYALFVWYYNLYILPKYSISSSRKDFWGKRLLMSNILGVIVMFILVTLHHLIFPKYNFNSMMMMYQFRGVLINLTIFMFIHFLYQSYTTQQILLQYERIKADNLNAQYELLKQQINPHFLFNSLNTLQAMIDVNDPEASGFVRNLSHFYRFSLENKKDDLILLKNEIEILESFIFLLKSRFEEGIDIRINLNDSMGNTYIPPFTLQLLVENCIKHNIVSLEYPLSVEIYEEQDFIVVKNNKQLKNNQHSFGIGLSNIKGRYSYICTTAIDIDSNEYEFTIKLPIIYENSNH
ncbi:histidine kinase [Chryseobacterium piperi]|uniref:Histidine kinase n=2 Tax=Chryseobacterium piperi TaxID=558152 RepID=A0A086ALD0_9FLAO|nr:histidine kinase [Chryseobacterium piperi]KFF17494.1 histidine kinase [Chryseobacterium piperi]